MSLIEFGQSYICPNWLSGALVGFGGSDFIGYYWRARARGHGGKLPWWACRVVSGVAAPLGPRRLAPVPARRAELVANLRESKNISGNLREFTGECNLGIRTPVPS